MTVEYRSDNTSQPPAPQFRHWEPTYTCTESRRKGMNKKTYHGLTDIARAIVEDHQSAGTMPRSAYEPRAMHVEEITGDFIDAGAAILEGEIIQNIDPVLDETQEVLENCEDSIAAAEQHPRPVDLPEGGATLSGHEAAAWVDSADAKIDQEESRGIRIHRRVPRLWRVTGRLAPWLEAAGLMAFVTYYIDVPLTAPWVDLLAFTLGLALVAVVIAGQTRLVHNAAEAHNSARESKANGNRHQADESYRTRNKFLIPAVLVALVITFALVYRTIAAVGDAGFTLALLLVCLAVATGLLLPALSYFARALDGSRLSRQATAVHADLSKDAAAQEQIKENARADVQMATENLEMLPVKQYPAAVQATQNVIDESHSSYNFVRVQIGGLSQDPPIKARRDLPTDDSYMGELSTGIPGARGVSLSPLADRIQRATRLTARKDQLAARLAAIPPHPWAKVSKKDK